MAGWLIIVLTSAPDPTPTVAPSVIGVISDPGFSEICLIGFGAGFILAALVMAVRVIVKLGSKVMRS